MNDFKREFAIYTEREMVTSKFLYELSNANISGLLTDNETERILKRYFINHTKELNYKNTLVLLRINKVLAYPKFELSKEYLYAINAYLFKGIYSGCGDTRSYNILKKEDILNGESAIYAKYYDIEDCLDYDFSIFKSYDKNDPCFINHLGKFITSIWQAHPFGDGNTRSIIIFLEKYLASLGISVDNNFFKNNSEYIRNALVKSCFATHNQNVPDASYFLSVLQKVIINPNLNLVPIKKSSLVRKKD